MDEAAVGMVALDPDGRVTVVNPRAESLLEIEVPVGRTIPAEGPLGEALSGWLDGFLATEDEEAGTEVHVGERRVRVRARRLGSSGTRRGVVVALEDVTDELRTERVLAWGEMARQVAHEVKNPLTPIKLSIQHIRRAWDDDRRDFGDILVKNADAMLKEIDRLAGIAQSFSRFGAPSDAGAAPLAEVDVGEVVDEVLALYGGLEAPIRFERQTFDGLPPVASRVSELKEVLVNLLENARVAIPDGGVVRIEAAATAGRSVTLAVVDDGVGISDESLASIFEPHFSTRSTGTGLGLAIVKRLVESWGGEVAVESTEGEGTRVSLALRTWADADPDGGGPTTVDPAS